jgi:hypothetical protein
VHEGGPGVGTSGAGGSGGATQPRAARLARKCPSWGPPAWIFMVKSNGSSSALVMTWRSGLVPPCRWPANAVCLLNRDSRRFPVPARPLRFGECPAALLLLLLTASRHCLSCARGCGCGERAVAWAAVKGPCTLWQKRSDGWARRRWTALDGSGRRWTDLDGAGRSWSGRGLLARSLPSAGKEVGIPVLWR